MSQRPPVQPRIGLTLDAEPPGGYSKLPWYAIRANYCEAVVRAGGVPIALPHEVELVDAYLDLLDGLLVTGGAFDLDPSLYGASERHATVRTKDRRTAFEMAITKAALQRDQPVLGVCGGQQLLNVALGGVLRLEVNSAHHQAAGAVGPGVVVSGRAPDGVIEAIEVPERRFCIGVQWHPEYRISAADDALFAALVEACRA